MGYEAHRLYEDFIKPAARKAKELGVPLMVVANVTYGGSVATALPLRQLQREGVRVVFTKQSSSDAHDTPHCLNPNLFTGSDLRFIVEQRPLMIVIDGSVNEHYPDAFRGFRNFVAHMNRAQGIDGFDWLQEGMSRQPFEPGPSHANLQRTFVQLMANSPQRPYGMHLAALRSQQLTSAFGDKPAPFRMADVRAPGVICVECTLPTKDRPAAPLDDDTIAQTPRLKAGRYGAKLKPLLHREARGAFKVFQETQATSWFPPESIHGLSPSRQV